MKVTVYEKRNCVQCAATKRWMEREGVEYATVDLESSPESMGWVQAMGFSSAPVVVVSDSESGAIVDQWSGFRLDRLRSLEGAQ